MNTKDTKLAKDLEVAFFIDKVFAKAYPRGITTNRERKIEIFRKWLGEDDKLPKISDAVSFAKNIR